MFTVVRIVNFMVTVDITVMVIIILIVEFANFPV